MERNWTKRKLAALMQGDAESVRQWQAQYGRFLYTWLYYQLDKDESQAASLTAETLSQALREIPAFDPEQTAMYLWLKDAAARRLQTALAQWGLKIRRPWAWSQMPPRMLDALIRMRSEPLPADITSSAAVTEIVQAALADLSEQDRDLLVRRYTRLDTLEGISGDLNLSTDKVNQQLYLARHAFRRGLFFLLQSANPDVAEPSGSGPLELFESNLESLLRSVTASAAVSSDSADQIKRMVLQTASEIAQNPPPPATAAPKYKRLAVITAIAAFLILAAIVGLWLRQKPSPPPESAAPPTASPPPAEPSRAAPPPGIDQEELKAVMEIGARGDVAELLNILKNGSYMAQMTAAYYLGRYADESAIDPLLQAQTRWYPEGLADNPFFRATVEILTRLGPEEEPQNASEPEQAAPPSPEPEQKPPLSGRVTDLTDTPLAGVQIALHKDSADPSASVPIAGFSATTDPQGRFAFDTLPMDVFLLVMRDPQQRIAHTRRLMRPVKNNPAVLDVARLPVVSGTVLVDGVPVARQTLMLSDHFQHPEQGVFYAETMTDAEGRFSFVGVPRGLYGLFARYMANRWTLLTQIPVEDADIAAVFDAPTASLVVHADNVPEPLRMVAVSLRYSPDSADATAEWKGVRTERDTVFEINRVVSGGYTLCVDFSNGVRTFSEIAVSNQPMQDIFVPYIPLGSAGMEGRFLTTWAEGLTLECAEPLMRVGLMAEEDGHYQLDNLPPAMYSLGAAINGLFVPYLEFGLFEDQPAAFDPDPEQLAKTRSPLFVYVTDAQGGGLASGQVWLAGSSGLHIAAPFRHGFFAAAPPGQYTLYTAFAGYRAEERTVTLAASDVRAPRSDANTVIIVLDR